MSSFSSSDSCTRCAARFNIASMVTGSWTPVNPKRNDANHPVKSLKLLEVAASDIAFKYRICISNIECRNAATSNRLIPEFYPFLIRGVCLVYANDKLFPYGEASRSQVIPGLKLFRADMVPRSDFCQSVT